MSTKPEEFLPELEKKQTALALHAETLVAKAKERDWMGAMRDMAIELQIDDVTKDPDLQAYLDAAERRQHRGTAYRVGDKIQASESVFMLDGLIKLGEANIIVGQPKVGKSSFSTGLIAALRDRRSQFLGRDLSIPGERMPVLIFGTDQSEGDWLHLLRREELVGDDQALKEGSLDFFCAMETGEEYNFTKDGIRHMREEIEKHQFPLVIIDSLSSMMEPCGIEENASRYAQPIRNAISQLRRTGATLLIIHHAVKRPQTWDWITECRGSSSISSVFSWGVLMRWVAQEDDGLARTDRRVGYTGKGRGSNESGGLMAEYLSEGGWTYLDGLEAAQQVERVGQRIMELGGVRAQIYDYLTMRTELGADVPSDEISSEISKTRSNVSRELNALKSRGLAHVVRTEDTGSRPKLYWQLTPAAKEWSLRGSERGFNGSFDNNDDLIKKIIVSNSQDGTAELLTEAKESIRPGTPVEVCRDGKWSNGYVVHDGSNPERVVISKTGMENQTISNLRWMFDLRPCESPYPTAQEELDF